MSDKEGESALEHIEDKADGDESSDSFEDGKAAEDAAAKSECKELEEQQEKAHEDDEVLGDDTLADSDDKSDSSSTAPDDKKHESKSLDEAKNESEDDSLDESAERRQARRKGVKLNRLISSKVIDGELQRECYLHLVDISDGGVRINSDDPFPADHPFNLEIGLAAFGTELATRKPRINLPVRLVWSKSLVGGMIVSGLAFHEINAEQQQIIATIMKGATPHGRRQHFRLNRVLGVELGVDSETTKWMYPLTLDLSVEGMRICQSETLNIGDHFPIKIFLEFGLPTIEAKAEVMWQEVMPSGRIQIGLRFDGITDHYAMAIKTYIDQCMEQDKPYRN